MQQKRSNIELPILNQQKIRESMKRFKHRLGNQFNHIQIKTQLIYRRALKKMIEIRDPTLRNSRSRLQTLESKYQGQRCFIMGNGPSLNKMDLSLLKNEIVWGSNRCYLLYDQIEWRPKFYTAVDTRVVPDVAEEINRIVVADKNTTCFFSFDHRRIIKNEGNVYWFEIIPANEADLPFGVFSKDPSKSIPSYIATVSIVMLQMAVYLGFSPIYLIGCDTNYIIPSSTLKDGPDGLVSTANDDPNHFTPNYFGKGAKWHDPHVERMFWQYEQVKNACEILGVQIYNSTVGGKLETFPRMDFEMLFD